MRRGRTSGFRTRDVLVTHVDFIRVAEIVAPRTYRYLNVRQRPGEIDIRIKVAWWTRFVLGLRSVIRYKYRQAIEDRTPVGLKVNVSVI
jgi:hypothetical protein